MVEDFLLKADNKKLQQVELTVVAFGHILHHLDGESKFLNCLYKQIYHKKEVGTGPPSDPYKNNCCSQTSVLKSIKFCVYYCKGHVYMYAKYQGAQPRDS